MAMTMKDRYKMSKPGNFKMLENADGTSRYEFYSRPIMKSNVDCSIAYYEPIIRHCKKLVGGSTYTEDRVSVEEGNWIYKELLKKGFTPVSEASFA